MRQTPPGFYQSPPPSRLRRGAWNRALFEVAQAAHAASFLREELAAAERATAEAVEDEMRQAALALPAVLAIGLAEGWISAADAAIVAGSEWPWPADDRDDLRSIDESREWPGGSAPWAFPWREIADLHGVRLD